MRKDRLNSSSLWVVAVLAVLASLTAVVGDGTDAGGRRNPESAPLPAAPVAGECTSDGDCAFPDEYCATAPGACGGSGSCSVRPDVCIQVYDPVCGCDGNTYSNSCVAASNGVNVAAEGACAGGSCAQRNEPCSQGADCCSGSCKRNGRCR